jgi:glycosyltransferase involved in cell wall biosynthesis
MIAFIQPMGLHSEGGGARILRALIENPPIPAESLLSIVTTLTPPPSTSVLPEVHRPLRPHFGRIESTRLGPWCWGISPLYVKGVIHCLEELFEEHNIKTIHAVPHGQEFWHAFEIAQRTKRRYILNCHDDLHHSLAGRPDKNLGLQRQAIAWQKADAVLVISEQMGEKYNELWGKRPYEVITDGLSNLTPEKKERPAKSLRVYFMGSVHISYHENFIALGKALDLISTQNPDWKVEMIVRGHPPAMTTKISVKILPWGTEKDVEKDMEDADFLYLPLPFATRHEWFSRYSLSTKMVTYLGTGLPILYHGPADAAAAHTLHSQKAAILCKSLVPEEIAKQIMLQANNPEACKQMVAGALTLAKQKFMLQDQRERFWRILTAI